MSEQPAPVSFCLYYAVRPPYAGTPMLLIAAALEEELETARSLCGNLQRIEVEKAKLWQAVWKENPIAFLKTGVGPKRSAASLAEALKIVRPSQVLVIGYAGALDPGLKLGSLVAVQKAKSFSLGGDPPGWEHVRLDGEFDLAQDESLIQSAVSAGLHVQKGDSLSSSYVLGNPVHKRLLHETFNAAIVDMETAGLACIAQSEAVPLSCIRAVSDEAEDTFLMPFSHDPSAGIPARAKQLIGTGMVETYRQWKTNSATANESLSRFLSHYLKKASASRFEIPIG